MSTALLSMYDFVEYRNPSTASVTVATGVDKSAVQQPSAAPHAKCERMTTGLFQISPSSPGATTTSTTHKMTGGIRRTVSSAAPSTGLGTVNPSARPLQTPATVVKSLSSNTQSARVPTSTHITSSKDPHKKLDRSFSEPAEKKNSAANGAAASSLGPSSRYKTELCRSFAEVGSCKYGDKCQFAHGDEELRTVSRHPKFKTENCKSFHSTGFCPYGPRCHFIHNNEEPKKQSIHMNNTNNQPNGVPSSPSAHSGAQRMFDSVPIPVIGAGAPSATASSQPVTNVPAAFPTASPPAVLAQHAAAANLVRPKALSLGSYSLGSSGEISSPSSQSGSPTSLNSFFTEDNFGLGTPFCLNGSNSRLHSTTAPLNTFPPSIHHHNHHGTFSFSPDSAFVSFNGANSVASGNTGASSNCSGSSLSFGSQKCIFGGSQPTLSSRYSPEPCAVDEATSSVIYSLFGSTPFGTESSQLSDLYRAISPIGKPLHYPISPESPVDSVASEIEALKLGEPQSVGFSPISPSFSTSSLSTASSSPPNGMLSELEALASSFGAVNIPRLPTFTKFAGQLTSAHE